MIPPHLSHQIYLSFFQQNDYTPPKCGELSEYTDSAHTEVQDPSSRCMNASDATNVGTTQDNFILPAPPDCKGWKHESESVKTMYLDATELFFFCRVLMIAQISAVNMDSGNLVEIMVFDEKTVAQAT